MYKFLLIILTLALLVSCSKDKSSEVADQSSSEIESGNVTTSSQNYTEADNSSYALEITPTEADRNSVLKLVSNGFDLKDAEIKWLLNDQPVLSSVVSQFNADAARKGDKLQASAIINDNKILSNIIILRNTPPKISRVKLLPEVFKSGDTLSVEAAANDPDEDEVTILYEWQKNGDAAGNSKQIESPLRRGDKFTVKITPFDGEDYGQPVVLSKEINNLPPIIAEDDKFNFNGTTYTYKVRAEDPDEDKLTYSLKSAKENMTIDPETGLITWRITKDFTGSASVTVSVTDGHGGESTRQLTFRINPAAKPKGKEK